MNPKTQSNPKGRTALEWLVVNPNGKLLAVLDSESEAYWFIRNRGHANESVYFKANCDYAAAPDLIEALRECITEDGAYCLQAEGKARESAMFDRLAAINSAARIALAKATDSPQ